MAKRRVQLFLFFTLPFQLTEIMEKEKEDEITQKMKQNSSS